MALPGRTLDRGMTDRLRGTFGFFTTKGPRRMAYLATRISLDQLRLLKTARQVIPRHVMTVRELMQRDIDDRRVREEIVGYLRPTSGGSAAKYFPPLTLAVLVRETARADAPLGERYPSPHVSDDGRFPRTFDQDDQVHYEERFYGNAFGLRIPIPEEDADVEAGEALFHGAELCWNRDLVDLLVIDGQHRLVGLKAALGELDAEDLARGYEKVAFSQEELDQLGLHSIAVSIVFPPEMHTSNADLQPNDRLVSVFRQVFVDVNRTAKRVSESRNILLDESDLIAVFTRSVVESFLTEGDLPDDQIVSEDKLPLYAFEWESPEKKEWQINDRRGVCSVGLLYRLIEAILLGEGRDSDRFRNELAIDEGDPKLDPGVVGRDGVLPSDLSPGRFAGWQREVLVERFAERWQIALVTLLRRLYPAARLVEALENQRIELNRQITQEPQDDVARRALDYLIGTPADQEQIEYVAQNYEYRVGRLDPESCARALSIIRDELLTKIDEELRGKPFARLFFSNLGQTELIRFVFCTLDSNLPSGEEIDRATIAEAFVTDFNGSFEQQGPRLGLFDSEKEWNNLVIHTLGTQSFKHTHVSGLLGLSLSFFDEEGAVGRMFASGEDWNNVRRHLYNEAVESLRKGLAGRLPYQFRYEPDITAISDEAKRRKAIDERVEKRATQILDMLNGFMREHAPHARFLPSTGS